MIFGEKKVDPKSSIIFLTKPLKILLIHLHEHITYEKYEFVSLYKGITLTVQGKCAKCTRVYKAPNRFCTIFK